MRQLQLIEMILRGSSIFYKMLKTPENHFSYVKLKERHSNIQSIIDCKIGMICKQFSVNGKGNKK